MISLTHNAKTRLDDYLHEVRACLQGCKTVDADEVEQNITEHIENELAEADQPVSIDELNAVLQKLGSPQQWVPEEELSVWRKMVLRLRTGPEDWRLAYISFALLILAFIGGRIGLLVLLPASVIASRAALSAAANHDLPAGQKWLIYPSLIILYTFTAFWLLAWPAFVLGALADQLENLDADVFPWSTGNDAAYWPVAVGSIVAATSLWCLIVTVIFKIGPRPFHWLFRPVTQKIKPKHTNWVMAVTLGLTGVGFAIVVLMLKYQGWYTYMTERARQF
ncbi:MAG: hypothetical protein ACYTEL_12460 [Planctomycetota bacterium]|jgi:hypothetical protein